MKKFDWKTLIILVLLLILASITIYGNGDECSNCLIVPEAGNGSFADVNANSALIMIQKRMEDPDFVLLDIRTPNEFTSGHIEGAINLNYYDENFRDNLDKLDKKKTYLIYCRTANRTGKTMPIMQDLGFDEVYNMASGITEWKDKGFAITETE